MKTIYEGMLRNGEPFKVLKLTIKEMEEILVLQDVVVESLEKKEVLQPLSREEYQLLLSGNGLVLGVLLKENLIACRALLVPPIDDEHLGWDIGLPAEELPNVIYQEISFVHPAYRGNKLQHTLASLIMQELLKTEPRFTYVCCTVAPFNIPSLKDKFAQGMEIAALKEKYGNRLRYIFVKKLVGEKKMERSSIAKIKMEDILGQQALLAKGWRGVQLELLDEEYVIWYAK